VKILFNREEKETMKKAEKMKLIRKMIRLKSKGIIFYSVPYGIATSEGPNSISLYEGITWEQLPNIIKRAEEKLESKDDCFEILTQYLGNFKILPTG